MRSLPVFLTALLLVPGFAWGQESPSEESPSAEETAQAAPKAAWEWMDLCWAKKAEGDLTAARAALEEARSAGSDPQLLALELGYLDLLEGDSDSARVHFAEAADGADPDLAARAAAEREQIQDTQVESTFAEPTEASFGPQYAALKAGYEALAAEDPKAARAHFLEAKKGDDPNYSAQARAELRHLPKPAWADVYFGGYGWVRATEPSSSDFVPTLRLRGFLHPIINVDLDPYIFVQVSRDVASRSEGPEGYPLIYADNHLMVGGGLQFRFWKKRVGLFVQAAPAFNLVRGEDDPLVALDVRAGAFFSLLVPNCDPEPQKAGARKERALCADIYSEAVYVSRFDHNLLAIVRGRLSLTYLVTGPVAWEPYVAVRLLKDIRNDYWNNLADAGIGHRWRLLAPFGLDLMVGLHGGGYFGLENVDPAPELLTYAEFRVQIGAYAAF